MVRQRRYSMGVSEAYAWAKQYPALLNYLSKLHGSEYVKSHTAQKFWFYCQYCGLDPQQILALKSSFDSLAAEQKLDEFVTSEFNIGGDMLPESLKWLTVNIVRGFYRVNYRALQPQAGKMDYIVKKAQGVLSKQKRCELYKAAYTPRDKAIVMIVLTSAIARESLGLLKFNHFEEDWMKQNTPHISLPGELIKGHGKGRYKGVRQETFITPEAKTAVIEYREWFTKTFNHIWRSDDLVFRSIKGEESINGLGVWLAFHRVAERAEVSISLHDGRMIVQTALETVSCPNNWIRKIKGRKVKGEESPYSKPAIEQLRVMYQKALPELQFLGVGFKASSDRSAEDEDTLSYLIMALKAGALDIDGDKFRRYLEKKKETG